MTKSRVRAPHKSENLILRFNTYEITNYEMFNVWSKKADE